MRKLRQFSAQGISSSVSELKSQIAYLDSSNKKLSGNMVQIQTSFSQYVCLSTQIISKHKAMGRVVQGDC